MTPATPVSDVQLYGAAYESHFQKQAQPPSFSKVDSARLYDSCKKWRQSPKWILRSEKFVKSRHTICVPTFPALQGEVISGRDNVMSFLQDNNLVELLGQDAAELLSSVCKKCRHPICGNLLFLSQNDVGRINYILLFTFTPPFRVRLFIVVFSK